MHILGLDIGGTKTSICLGTKKGDLLASQRLPTNALEGPTPWFRRVRATVDEVLHTAGVPLSKVRAVGIACPGPMSVRRGMMLESPNMPGWINVPVVRWVRNAFRRPVFIDNDANACGLAEWLFGSHKGAQNLVYLTMSSGLGGGIIVNGRIAQGTNDLFGEVGHHVIDPKGPRCPCGRRGCWEVYCGGINAAHALRRDITARRVRTAILDAAGGDPARIDFKAFLTAVKKRDAYALRAWKQYVEHLAHGMGTIIQFYNPEVILLGTIGIHAGNTLLVPLRKAVLRYAWKVGVNACEIRPSALGTKIGDLSTLAVAVCGLKPPR